ncbi:DENN domain-containing protein 2B-like, partial [Psammomys obesus]|uniref:DENN domain-containing protein 2B-like n=1 Tax=Psammomys obesus TaxID=48139 RepID=UPI00245370D0
MGSCQLLAGGQTHPGLLTGLQPRGVHSMCLFLQLCTFYIPLSFFVLFYFIACLCAVSVFLSLLPIRKQHALEPSGKGPRLPEVYCVISRLGCFGLFSKVLDEVERRRGISAALVYPFMRSLMESPFPAPGKTIKVKTFLPGAGNE